jgi:hypothetical protein
MEIESMNIEEILDYAVATYGRQAVRIRMEEAVGVMTAACRKCRMEYYCTVLGREHLKAIRPSVLKDLPECCPAFTPEPKR